MSHAPRRNLTIKLVRITLLVGLGLGILLGGWQIVFDLIKEQKQTTATVSQIVGMVREQAALAGYTLDRTLAARVVNGLLEYT
ncbi:MAG: hypothetical protein PVG60_07925, partial [Desulfarculaceae bacterium]